MTSWEQPHVNAFQRHPLISCAALGAAAACGFAPLDLWPLTLACLAAWMWLIHDASSCKEAAWRGWMFGVGHFTINDNWFQHAFDFQDRMPPVLGYVAPLALALYLAIYPALAAGCAWFARARRPDGGFILAFAALWIVSEWLRSVVFTGYAWDPLGVIWVPVQPVATIAALVGTYALSGLTVLLAGALLLFPGRRRLAAGVAGLVILLGLQGISYRGEDQSTDPANPRLVVVQPNVGLGKDGQPDLYLLYTRLLAGSGRPGAAPRLVLWPEGVLRDPVEDGYPDAAYSIDPARWRARLADVLGPRDILLAGGDRLLFDARGQMTAAANSVFAIDARGRLAGRYDKAHLVPYGEYLPMPWLLRPLGLNRLVPGDFDFLPGPGPRAIELAGFGAIGVQVCYEIIFSGEVVDPARRPRLIFNPSNDAWFGRWGPPQHLAQARMRAIEEGLPVVRATPNGISAVIAADGRLIATMPHYRQGTIDVPMPPGAAPTLFSRVGNLAAGLVTLALTLGAVALRQRWR